MTQSNEDYETGSPRCDVEGCNARALVELLQDEDGLRCRRCLEADLNMRTIA